jgi:hypothetical protein
MPHPSIKPHRRQILQYSHLPAGKGRELVNRETIIIGPVQNRSKLLRHDVRMLNTVGRQVIEPRQD